MGYKHITVRHEGDWQNKYNEAVAMGWNPTTAGIHSWDDLMHAGVGTAITYPQFVSGIKSNQTRCVVATVWFVEVSTGIPAFSFNTRASFAVDSDRLITAFPQGGGTC